MGTKNVELVMPTGRRAVVERKEGPVVTLRYLDQNDGKCDLVDISRKFFKTLTASATSSKGAA